MVSDMLQARVTCCSVDFIGTSVNFGEYVEVANCTFTNSLPNEDMVI